MRNLFFLVSLFMFIGISCQYDTSLDAVASNSNSISDNSSHGDVSFSKRVATFYANHKATPTPDNNSALTDDPCDDNKECSNPPQDVTYHIDGNSKEYPPLTVPFECGLDVKMTVRFCLIYGKIELVVSDLKIVGYDQPLSAGCATWVTAFLNLSNAEQEEVVRKIYQDLEASFEYKLADDFLRANPDYFDPCKANGDCPFNNALTAKYVKGSCTKFCWVYDPENCGGPLPWCVDEVKCYEDGCCRVEKSYCIDQATGKTVVCMGPALYDVGLCTIPLPNNCIFDPPFPCNTLPRCEAY